ncbi:MAG: glucose 1-dehydrogenase [Bacteroidetes bacterium]|nr:MAG: glucose 1-dehydrogenase [Bacteroidota bacterium]
MMSLEGKVSIITGGSRGIGAATALLLAKAGAQVVVNYVKNHEQALAVVRSIQDKGGKAVTHQADVSKASEAAGLVERAIIEFGKVDIVVNNAGIWTFAEIGSTPESIWDETIDVNLKGVFNICNAVVPYFKKQGGGKIINITSTAGLRGEAFHSHYAASKGGVQAFTKSLATELAPHNILVNNVAPGWVDTELNEEVFADEQFVRQVIDAIPLKRIATAEDVAGSILFLASDFARHITGTTININGGSVLV